MNLKKFKKFVKDHKFVIIETCVVAVVSVATYTYVCGKAGYVMNKPLRYDDTHVYVKTPTGRIMYSLMTPDA